MSASPIPFLRSHMLTSACGFVRVLFRTPFFALRLLLARVRYFATRRLSGRISTPDGFLIETPAELVSYWSFFVEREGWAEEWVEPLRRANAPVVLDVGANAGLFTHLVWTLNPRTRISVFEPLPKMAAKISAWKSRVGATAEIRNVAVSDRSGTATFYAAGDNDTSASLKSPGASHSPITVQVATLDETITEPEILLAKVDVEGFEPQVLAGARSVLKRLRFIVAEAHSPEALAAIQATLGDAWNTRRVGECDYLFTRRL